jgi:hypothetical protein
VAATGCDPKAYTRLERAQDSTPLPAYARAGCSDGCREMNYRVRLDLGRGLGSRARNRARSVLVFGLCMEAAATVWAQESNSAEQLLEQSCNACHAQMFAGKADQVYVRENRKVKTLAGLRDQTKLWNITASAKWSEQELEAVVQYLNRTYYRF